VSGIKNDLVKENIIAKYKKRGKEWYAARHEGLIINGADRDSKTSLVERQLWKW
jgi:hypothetical protein